MNRKILSTVTMVVLLTFIATMAPAYGKAKSKPVEQKIVYNLQTEPDSIDPQLGTSSTCNDVIMQTFEGLLKIDKDGGIIPGVAESYTISKDGKTYTFKLRKTAKWTDGKPVTAKDFVYSWRRLADKKTAAEYANFMTAWIYNASEFYNGKVKAEEMGVKAVNDYTLEVKLKAPVPFFREIVAFPSTFPVRQDVVSKNPENWATKPDTYIGNGPFKMVKWSENEAIEFVKNPNYWGAKNVKLEKLVFVMNNDPNSALGAYENGDIDFLRTVPISEVTRLKNEKKLTVLPCISTYFVRFNVTKKPFNDPRVRRALALAINQQDIIDTILKTGQKPATAFAPYGVKDADGRDFRKNGGTFVKQNIAEARKLLSDAGYPNGKGFPQVTYLYNTNQNHQRIGEMLQDMWRKALNINVKLVNQEFRVYLDSQDQLNYDMSRSGWNGDYNDASTFLDMFVTGDGNNDTGWSNKEYDSLIAKAKIEGNNFKRLQYYHQAERILMKDMPVAPIYFYTTTTLIKPYVKGIQITSTVKITFQNAYIDENAYAEYMKNN